MTPRVWPWAVSTAIASTPALTRLSARCRPCAPDADCPGREQAAAFVFGGVGEVLPLENVLIGDQPFEVAVSVDQGQFFDTIAMKDLLRFLQGSYQVGL